VAVRLGLLTTAQINRAILGARDAGDVEVVAVGSRDAARAGAYAREHAIERAHGSYEALIADDGIDAVYIALPNALHVEWSIRALEAGKHVLCEKPLSADAREAERAFDAADRAGRVLMEAFMYRHHPQIRRLHELVRDGAVGRLRALFAAFTFQLDDEVNVRLSRELGGGALLDIGTYCVSIARLLAGEPVAVRGVSVEGETGIDVSFYGGLRFEDSVVAQFRSSFEQPAHQRLEVVGDGGTILLEAPFRADGGGALLLNGEPIGIPPANAYRLQLENFADAVAGRAAPLVTRADSVGQAATLAALRAAAAS
jgi:predicted dehydrogenase